MPDTHSRSQGPGTPVEDRFLSWMDELVDPATGIPVPDPDLADLAGTAAFVQQVAGLDGAPALAPGRADAMWEDIMHTTTATPTVVPTLPGSGTATPIRPHSPIATPAPGWRSYLATALLIAAIVVAGAATIWRVAGPFGGDDDPDQARQLGIAGHATPATQTADRCPLANDMLVFVGEAPHLQIQGIGPSLAVVEPNGDFVITCPGVEQPTMLMTGITDATPLQWPGTVLLDRADGSAVAINVATGQQVELGSDNLAQAGGLVEQFSMPWLVTPNNMSATDWRFTNLEMMTSFTLSDELGGVLEEGRVPSMEAPHGSDVAVISFKGSLSSNTTLAPGMKIEPPPDTDEATVVDVPEGALVVDSTLQARRWIDTRGEIAVNPNGTTIAYQTQSGSGSTIRIEDSISGDMLAELTSSGFIGVPSSDFAFDGDGDSLVYLDGNSVWIATWDGGLETTQVESGDLRPREVRTGNTPNHVLLTSGSDAAHSTDNATSISILDTESGQLAQVDGLVIDNTFPFMNLASQLDYVVTVTTAPETPDQMVMHLVDLDSGAPVLSSEPIRAPAVGNDPIIAYSGDGAIAVVTIDGTTLYLNANTGKVGTISTASLSSIERLRDVTWFMVPSNDGRYLYAFGSPDAAGAARTSSSNDEYFTISLLSSKPNWSSPISAVPNRAILGIAASDDTSHEPSVLEAQEFASPVATLTSPADTCDLSGDIPIVQDTDAPSWSDTALVLADGTLTLQCDGVSTIVADGVTEVLGTTWPGAVLLTMADGSLRGVNLVTGSEGDLGPASLFDSSPFGPQSRWLGVPANEESTDWRVIDLKTMESLLLSDVLGGVLPRPTVSVPYAWSPAAVVIGFPGTPVGAQAPAATPPARGGATPVPATPTAELPSEGAALVIDGSLSNTSWTESYRPSRVTAAISPDGKLLAVQEMKDDTLTVRVETLSAGELVAETGIEYGAGDTMLLLDDGAGLLHLTPSRLERVTWDAPGEVRTDTLLTFDTPRDNPVLVQTADPDVALVGSTSHDGTSVGYLVEVASGTVTKVPGLLTAPFVNPQYMDGVPPRYVLTAAKADEQRSVVRLIDATTGEAVLESDPVDLPLKTMTTQDAALRDGGTLGMVFLPDGTTLVLDASANEVFTTVPPEGIGPWTVIPSPSGTFLVAYSPSARAFHATTPETSWDEAPADTPARFVPGTGTPAERRAPA